jgi:hypothetical protein
LKVSPFQQVLALKGCFFEPLVDLTADDETQVRYDALADKKNQGNLTPLEEEELESLVRANTLLGLLKAEAQLVLSHTKPA